MKEIEENNEKQNSTQNLVISKREKLKKEVRLWKKLTTRGR
jgi:hypothetical protein